MCGLCLGLPQTSWQIHQRVQQQPPARAATPPQILRVGEHPQHLGNAQVVPAHSMPCSLVSSSGRTWVVRGDVLWMGVAGWRLVSPHPLIPQLISSPHLLSSHPRGVQAHPSPHSGTSSSHTAGWATEKCSNPERCRGLKAGLVTQVHGRSSNPTATLQSPSQLLSQALKMCGQSSPWLKSCISARATC